MDKLIAEKIAELGGRAYYVGGYVRDSLLEKQNKDIDIEIHRITEQEFVDMLSDLGYTTELVGEAFGVYKVTIGDDDFDFSFPRTEVKTGNKHTDFQITVDPFIGEEQASERRDFTINALMQDVLTGEILDFHNGQEDLQNGVIRHVSDKFSEDSLRVFRAAQFASRFNFDVAPETAELCKQLDTSQLPQDRVREEFAKAMLKSNKPSKFFETLKEITNTSVFDEALDKDVSIIDNLSKDQLIEKVYWTLLPETYNKITNERTVEKFMKTHPHDKIEALAHMELMPDILMTIDETSPTSLELANTINPNAFDETVDYNDLHDKLVQNSLTGKELLELGYQPSPQMQDYIKQSKELAFMGMDKNAVKGFMIEIQHIGKQNEIYSQKSQSSATH